MAKDRRKLQHIHSSVPDKQPTPQTLEVGEIAVNNADKKEFLSIKSSDDKVVRFSSDEQMITWMEKKEVVPYVGQVRGDTYNATTADTHGSVGITNNDLLNNKSNIVVKMNQVAAANTPKYDKINGAKDIYGHYVNLDVDGTVQGAGFSIDMSRYAMIGANPTFSSLTVTDKTDLSGNTTIANGDGTGTRNGHTLNIKTTDVVATDTNWTETITNKTENISGRTTTIGNGNESLHVIGTTTEVHDKAVDITNKNNVVEKTSGTTTIDRKGAVSANNQSDVTEITSGNSNVTISGTSKVQVSGSTTADTGGDVTVTTSGKTTETKKGAVNETNLNDKTETTVGNNYENVSGRTVINHSGTTNYNYTGGTTLSGSTLASTTTGNTSLNVSGNTSVKTVGTTTLDSTGTTTIQSTGNGSDVLIYAKDNLTATATTITATSSDNTTVNVGKNLTENITGNTTVTTTGNTLITSPTDGKSITISETGKNGVITIKTPGDNGVTNIESLGSAGKINIKANKNSDSEVSVVGWAISNSAYTSTTRADYVDITGTTEVNIDGGTINTNASTSVTNYDSAYTSASTATTIIGTADTQITSAKTVISTADTKITSGSVSGNTLEVKEATSLTFSGGTLTSTTTGSTTLNSSGSTTIQTNGNNTNVTIQSTGTGGDVFIYAKDNLTETATTVSISGSNSVNITGTSTVNLTGQTINVDASTSTTEVTSAYTSATTATTIIGTADTKITSGSVSGNTLEIKEASGLTYSGGTLSSTTTGNTDIKVGGKTKIDSTSAITIQATDTNDGDINIYAKDALTETGKTVDIIGTNSTTIKTTGNDSDIFIYAKDKVDISGTSVNITGDTTIDDELTVKSGITVSAGGTDVTGDSTFRDKLTVKSGITVSSGGVTITKGGLTVTAGGADIQKGGLTVSGDSTFKDKVTINSGLTVNSNGAKITGNSEVDGSLTVKSGITVSTGGTDVTGDSTFQNNLTVKSGLTVSSNGVTITKGGLTVTAGGADIQAGGLTVSGDSTFKNDVSVSGTLTASTISATTISAGTIHTSGLEGKLSWSYGSVINANGGSYDGSASSAITIPNSLSHISSSHTHTLSEGATDLTGTSVSALNSITGSVGTMAFKAANSYSSATEVNNALAGKSGTAHTHTLTIASESDGDSQISLGFGSKYKLTAGGNDYIFTMPSSASSWNNVTAVTTSSTNGNISVNGSNVAVKGLGTAAYKAEGYFAGSGHTHSIYVKKSGDTMTGDLTVQGSIYQTSDERMKENVTDVEYEYMANANMVKIKKFNFIDDKEKKTVYGVIAQDVEAQQLNDVVVTKNDGMKAVDYTGLSLLKIAYLEQEVRRLNKIIEKLIGDKQ